jgi:IS4 transposase
MFDRPNISCLLGPSVADIYEERWQIETFSRRFKLNLLDMAFVETPANAVLKLICVGMIAYRPCHGLSSAPALD